jgi:hypothetical protein
MNAPRWPSGGPTILRFLIILAVASIATAGSASAQAILRGRVPHHYIMQRPNDLTEGRIQLLSSPPATVTPLKQAGDPTIAKRLNMKATK